MQDQMGKHSGERRAACRNRGKRFKVIFVGSSVCAWLDMNQGLNNLNDLSGFWVAQLVWYPALGSSNTEGKKEA